MAKAINWPAAFRDEVLGEDTHTLRCALRPGDLYYIHRYWVPDEVVDIRVNHRKIRKATIVGDLKLCSLSELTADDLAALKTPLRSVPQLIEYLTQTYPQAGLANEQTPVTLVYYKNLAIDPDEVEAEDDPHM